MSTLTSPFFMLKKNIIYFITVFFVLVFLFSIGACLKDDNCKECRIQTYEDNVLVSSGNWVEYCDQELKDVEGQTSTVGTMTTKMVCR